MSMSELVRRRVALLKLTKWQASGWYLTDPNKSHKLLHSATVALIAQGHIDTLQPAAGVTSWAAVAALCHECASSADPVRSSVQRHTHQVRSRGLFIVHANLQSTVLQRESKDNSEVLQHCCSASVAQCSRSKVACVTIQGLCLSTKGVLSDLSSASEWHMGQPTAQKR